HEKCRAYGSGLLLATAGWGQLDGQGPCWGCRLIAAARRERQGEESPNGEPGLDTPPHAHNRSSSRITRSVIEKRTQYRALREAYVVRMMSVHTDQRDSAVLVDEEVDRADVDQLRPIRQLEMEQQAVLDQPRRPIRVESGAVRAVARSGQRVPGHRVGDGNAQVPDVLQFDDVAGLIELLDHRDGPLELKNQVIPLIAGRQDGGAEAAVHVWKDPRMGAGLQRRWQCRGGMRGAWSRGRFAGDRHQNEGNADVGERAHGASFECVLATTLLAGSILPRCGHRPVTAESYASHASPDGARWADLGDGGRAHQR